MMLFMLLAGMAFANHGPRQGFIVSWLLGVVFVMVYGRECMNQGAQPLTHLKPGEYRVEAVINDSWGRPGLLVIGWHVAEGYFEHRLMDAHKCPLTGPDPVVGDNIIVRPSEPGVGIVAKSYVAKNA